MSTVVYLMREVDLYSAYIIFESMSRVEAKWRSE